MATSPHRCWYGQGEKHEQDIPHAEVSGSISPPHENLICFGIPQGLGGGEGFSGSRVGWSESNATLHARPHAST